MKIENKILKFGKVEWQKIQDLQPDDAKPIFNYEHLKKSLINNGFANPLFVWEDEKKALWSVDGKTRREVLRDLQNDVEVPKVLPAIYVDAKDRQEAIKILLEVFNMRENPFDFQVLEDWIEVEQVEVNLESVNVKLQEIEIDNSDIELGGQDNENLKNNSVGILLPLILNVKNNTKKQYKELYNISNSNNDDDFMQKILKYYYDNTI